MDLSGGSRTAAAAADGGTANYDGRQDADHVLAASEEQVRQDGVAGQDLHAGGHGARNGRNEGTSFRN